MNEQTRQAPFRIGGYYRNGYGALCRVGDAAPGGKAQILRTWDGGGGLGFCRLSDGTADQFDTGRGLSLIPGELNAQGEPIAPTFYCAAETIAVATEAGTFNDAMWRALKPAFDSRNDLFERSHAGAYERNRQMRDALDKLAAVAAQSTIHRQEAGLPDGWWRTSSNSGSGNLVISTNKPVAEKLRPRLTWADSKPFDAFKDFSSSSDTATPDHAYNHPLTRVADAGAQTNPVCGSAWLVVR